MRIAGWFRAILTSASTSGMLLSRGSVPAMRSKIMTPAIELHPEFVTDAEGRQTAVILPIAEYNGLLEDLADLAAVAERIAEPTIPHALVVKELKDDGYLSN
jgi:hypothetical protein